MDMEVGSCVKSLGSLLLIITGMEEGPLSQPKSEDEQSFVRNEQITLLETISNIISN